MEKLEFLDTLTTKRLLEYYRKQRKARKTCHSDKSYQSYTPIELAEWDVHLTDVKKLLDHREHVVKETPCDEEDFICGGKDTTYKNLKKRIKEMNTRR
jgi:hypothetical protein